MKRTLYLTIIVALFGCAQPNSNQLINGVPCEQIDFYSFNLHENVYIPDELIEEKTYIKLDASTDEAFFKQIDKIALVGDRIYVLDQSRNMNKLLVFNIDGSFVGLVGRRGQGPGEYLQITDFTVDADGVISFVDGQFDKDRIFVFDKDLHFVSARKLPFETDIIQSLPDDRFLVGVASWNPSESNVLCKVAVVDADIKILDTCLLYDEFFDNNMWISRYTFIKTEKQILYNKQIDNNVYAFSHTGKLEKAYRFDFGKKNVPDEYRKAVEQNWDGFSSRCCLKEFVVVTDRYFIGALWDEMKTKTFIIDRQTNNLYISPEVIDKSFMAGYYDNQIITYIYPGKYEDIKAQNLPADVEKHVEDENFAICLYRLK
jgi:hypothetical protein